MPKPTILNEARSLQGSLLNKHPNGTTIPRATFDKLLVLGYGKSKHQADAVTKTGEIAGLWMRRHNYKTGESTVEIFPLNTVQV